MAANNEQVYNQNYKMRYSKEIELLDTLEHQLNEAANNLDIDKMESLITEFEGKFYSDLRISNKQSFDILKASAHQRILEIKKRKELLAQRQIELQNTEDAYQKLQYIKKMVLGAKTRSELEKAKKKYEKWKSEIGKSRKIKFGWKYNKKVDNLKSAIDEGIGPEDAINDFKVMIDRASHSGGFDNDSQIKDWMSKYPLNAFHEVYKKEVRDLTDKAFSLVKEPVTETQSKDSQYLVTLIPGFLFMSPTQAHAVNDLKKIMDKNSNNFKGILEWIYIYRNVSFSEPYRKAISTLIPPEYGLNLNKQYSIPTFYDNGNLKSKEVKNLIKDTVINYFGILLCGNDLSTTKQQLIVDAFKQAKVNETLLEMTKTDENVDKILKSENESIMSVTYSEDKNITEMTIDNSSTRPTESKSEAFDIGVTETDNTSSSTTLKEVPPEIQVEISSILPDIEFAEEQITSSVIEENTDSDKKLNDYLEEKNKDMVEEVESSNTENNSIEGKSSSDSEINTSYEEITESALEIPLQTQEEVLKQRIETPEKDILSGSSNSVKEEPYYDLKNSKEESNLNVTYSDNFESNSEISDPYQLTEYDIDNIENIYSFVNSRTKQNIKPESSLEIEEQEENDLLYQKIKD